MAAAETLLLKKRFPARLLAILILIATPAAAEPMQQQFIGKWGDALVSIALQNLSAGDITGEVEEMWIDSAGERRSGVAKVVGVRQADGIDLFLQPQSLVTLPFVFHADVVATSPMTLRIGDGVSAAILQPGNNADYRLAETTRSNPSDLTAIEMAGLDSAGGCQCDARKRAHVAVETASFARDGAHLLARVNDYAMAVDATRAAFAAGQQASLASMNSIRSLSAFNQLLQKARAEIETDLDGATQRCRQRQLSADEAITAEAKLWRETCLSVGRGNDLYQMKKTAYATEILPHSPR